MPIEEEWKDVKDYEGIYQISNLGRLKIVQRTTMRSHGKKLTIKEKIARGSLNFGYIRYSLCNANDKEIKVRAHRLVAGAFIPNPENKPYVCHRDDVRTNNVVTNLYWGNNSENQLDSVRNGGHKAPMKDKFGALNHRSRTVHQLNTDGTLYAEYGSVREAERITGLPESNIAYACREHRLYKDYLWEYI